jgi:hypothetical protein
VEEPGEVVDPFGGSLIVVHNYYSVGPAAILVLVVSSLQMVSFFRVSTDKRFWRWSPYSGVCWIGM